MRPVRPSGPQRNNQIKVDASAHQQAMPSNPCIPNPNNLGSIQTNQLNGPPGFSQLLPFNQQFPVSFNGPNGNLSCFNGNMTSPNTHFPNVPNQNQALQNSLINLPHSSSGSQNFNNPSGHFFAQTPQPHGQMFMQNCQQIMNQMRPMQLQGCTMPGGQLGPQTFQNMNQICNLQQGFFSQNLFGLPQFPSFNPNFMMNQQLGMMNTNGLPNNNVLLSNMFVQPTVGQNGLQGPPVVAQESMKKSHPPDTSTQGQMKGGIVQGSQETNAADGGSNLSSVNQKKLLNYNLKRHDPRFQNSNGKGKVRPFNGKGGKGKHELAIGKSQPSNTTKQSKVETQRTLPLNYSEKEIQQWREERRRNHPSNIEKLATEQAKAEVIENDKKRRRQELKQILAKQAELGVEVAEIPSTYLVDTETHVGEREKDDSTTIVTTEGKFRNEQRNNLVDRDQTNAGRTGEENSKTGNKNGKFRNKYSKRQRNGRGGGRFGKKPKIDEEDLTDSTPTSSKPTLLQKLLSSDIKRDKSHLLQVFRFMVINSFFKDFPEKPLEYPSVNVKEPETVLEKAFPLDLIKEVAGQNDNEDDDNDDDGRCSEDEDIVNLLSKETCTEVAEPEEGEVAV